MQESNLTLDESRELRQIATLTRGGGWTYRSSKAVLRSLQEKGLIEMTLNSKQLWAGYRVTEAGAALAATLEVR